MYAAIVACAFVLICLLFIWKKIIPRMVDKRTIILINDAIADVEERERVRLIVFHETEVVPVQEALRAYPPIIAAIHEELDLLCSEGQAPKKLLPRDIISFDEFDEQGEKPFPKS